MPTLSLADQSAPELSARQLLLQRYAELQARKATSIDVGASIEAAQDDPGPPEPDDPFRMDEWESPQDPPDERDEPEEFPPAKANGPACHKCGQKTSDDFHRKTSRIMVGQTVWCLECCDKVVQCATVPSCTSCRKRIFGTVCRVQRHPFCEVCVNKIRQRKGHIQRAMIDQMRKARFA